MKKLDRMNPIRALIAWTYLPMIGASTAAAVFLGIELTEPMRGSFAGNLLGLGVMVSLIGLFAFGTLCLWSAALETVARWFGYDIRY